MDTNAIGKFEMRNIVNAFDTELIQLFGLNMLDAHITRYEAIYAYDEFRCPRKTAEAMGVRRGLTRLLSAG